MCLFFQAIDDFDMIKEGDRILVCLSGGKDSLSLLHTLKQYQYFSTRRKNVSLTLIFYQMSSFPSSVLINFNILWH